MLTHLSHSTCICRPRKVHGIIASQSTNPPAAGIKKKAAQLKFQETMNLGGEGELRCSINNMRRDLGAEREKTYKLLKNDYGKRKLII